MDPVFVTALITLALIPTLNGQSVDNLPPADQVVNLTERYHLESTLHAQVSEDRIFPSIRFTHNGSIIGWQFPAAPGVGFGRPSISVLRLIVNNRYERVSQTEVDSCIVRTYQLGDGFDVELHESGPASPIPFEEGDIFGLHLRNSRAHFVPYLYNSTLLGENESLSYYLPRPAIRNDEVNLDVISSDSLQPLFALLTCANDLTDSMDLGIPMCMGVETHFNNVSCLEEATDPPSEIRSDLLVVAIAVPILVILLILVCVMAAVMIFCVYSIRASKRRRHSLYAEEVAMDDLNGVEQTNYAEVEDRTYDKVFKVDSILREVGNDMYVPHESAGNYHQGNGAVANYEEPVFSLSQSVDSVKHLYDKPQDVAASNTPPPPFPSTPSPQSHHSYLPPTPSPGSHHSHLTPTTPSPQPHRANSSGYYHSLERHTEDKPAASSLEVPSVANTYHNLSVPDLTPPNDPRSNTLPAEHSSNHSVSPKPRHRLKSAPSPGSRQIPLNASFGSDPSHNHDPLLNQGYSSLRSHDFTFKLETGVYVPTKKQLTELSGNPRDSIFDDTIYDFLSKKTDGPYENNWSFFEELDSFWRPASNTNVLYQQLASRKYREIIRKQIQIESHLGSGEFGTVCKGAWRTEQGELDVAVKMLTSKSSEETTVRFLQEAAIMGQFRHPNIVRLHGVVTVGEPVMIVLELVNNGDLRKYLKSLRPSHSQPLQATLPQQLLDFSSQIALGMEYLARKEFVHRDLAARNILLTDDFICKIADFGLSRDLEDEEYYISNGGKIPIKWTAPEALHYRKYSPASDVWSFGALLYEIWSLGHTPFTNKTPEETVALVDSGYRLPPPPGCPRAIYQLMIECWHPDALDRLSFTDLVKSLSLPEEELLCWSHSDVSVLPQAFTLGSDMTFGEKLFPDLQSTYIS